MRRSVPTLTIPTLTIALVAVIATLAACATPRRNPTTFAGEEPSGQTTSAPTSSRPIVETKTVTETESIPFPTTTVSDGTLASGMTEIRTVGVNGVKTLTYEVTTTGGVQTAKKLIKEEITTPPVTQVTAVGTKVAAAPPPAQSCDPNYSGACVPIASDVDCAGGGGNGPAYVRGPVYVIGSDIYDLDRDGDGVACE